MIAIISDVHGNYPALKSVIQEIHKQRCTHIISLGDIAGYYCMINECIELCKQEGIVNITGNHDYYLSSGVGCPRSSSANVCLKYQSKIITPKNLEWLQTSVPFIDTGDISMRHGGWQDLIDEYIYEFSFEMIQGREETIFASGHTHKQMLKTENGKTYVNPGSVGQPRDYDPRAAYAIITDDYDVQLRRVQYPIHEIADEMKRRGFQDKLSQCLFSGTKIGEVV